jgi:hypothetical protein
MLKVTGLVNDDAVCRRSFVQAGVLGLGGLSLGHLFKARAASVRPPQTSVILFWMSGGPGPMETWDPKPDAVDQFRGPFKSIPTAVPSVRFSELLPEQAKLMDKFAVLRTVNHGSGDHTKSNHWMLTGFEGPAFNAADFMTQRRPSLGSATAKLRGANQPGMPAYVAVPHLRGGTDNFFHYSTYLGRGYDPFIANADPNDPKFQMKNLALPPELPLDRVEDRRQLLKQIDNHRRTNEHDAAQLDPHFQKAYSLLTSSSVAEAFKIDTEPAKLRDRYGRHTFGQSALLARRLVEAGVTFVTVNCQPWDHHGTAGRYKTEEGAKLLIPPFDRALASLVQDLIDRGLYENTLVVAMGEFGRTPRMNADGGRDHWGNTFSVLMGCGSMRMGQVIGRSTPKGEYVADRSITPQDVTATIFHHLGINAGKVTFPDNVNKPIALVESGEPIRELLLAMG